VLTDKRESYYEGKGIGCYMFRIDDDTVVDATMKGNAARFINHSCDVSAFIIVGYGVGLRGVWPVKEGEQRGQPFSGIRARGFPLFGPGKRKY
jgi:SET domain-containing protein